jgi:hypothetical protein
VKKALELYVPDFGRIIQSPVSEDCPEVGWHTNVLSNREHSLAGGTSSSKETSLRIAVAECIERAIVKRLRSNELDAKKFLLDEVPTTCGFACGFEDAKTRMRAVAEASERWAWHNWIDLERPMEAVDVEHVPLSPISKHLISEFDHASFFQQRFTVEDGELKYELKFCAVIAYSGTGAFPGSRVSNVISSPDWEHAIIEAWRHLKIFQHPSRPDVADFLLQRILYFGNHADEACRQALFSKTPGDFGSTKLRIVRKVEGLEFSVQVYRAVCNDYLPWHMGEIARFVY